MMNKTDLEKQRDFLLGYGDAKSSKTINFEGKSIDYIKGYNAFLKSLTQPVDDYQRGYEDAKNGRTVCLDNASSSYIEGYRAFQEQLTDLLGGSGNSIK